MNQIVDVTDQAGVDAALKAGDIPRLWGNARAELWDNASAVLWGNASAVLWGNASAELWDNASAVLWGNARAELWDNARAELWDNARAELRGNASAVLWDNARAELWDNASAELWGNARAVLWGNASAVLWGNASAVLWGNASAELRDNARAVLRGNASAELRDFACVCCLSRDAKIMTRGSKTVVIRPAYPRSPTKWCSLKGIPVVKGKAHLWKAVKADGTDFRTGTVNYLAECEIVAPDWNPKLAKECGFALHLSDSPSGARYFVPAEHRATFRLLEVEVRLRDCRCFPGLPDYPMKLRARACRVVREVPRDYADLRVRERPFPKKGG